MNQRTPIWLIVAISAAIVAAAALFGFGRSQLGPDGFDAASTGWDEVTSQAEGQTVRLWMWGGEAALNDYIDDEVIPAAAGHGVTLERVPIDDTASAMGRLVAEADSAVEQGAIDLLWVNGKNFDQGKDAGLWLDRWVPSLPNVDLLDPNDPTLWNDFGVPTDGQEMPWSRAAFVFAYDTAKIDNPPQTFAELAAYARANPGRVTYPAPPDFTGSAFVRQAVQALGEDEAFAMLADVDQFLWQGGQSYPSDQAELERLFAADEIDLAMSYNPNFVDVAVSRGSMAETVAPYVFETGTLSNVSFLAIANRASSPQGAMVVANLMLGPDLQQAKAEWVGIPSVLTPSVLKDAVRTDSEPSPYILVDYATPLEELPASKVPEIDRRWISEIG